MRMTLAITLVATIQALLRKSTLVVTIEYAIE